MATDTTVNNLIINKLTKTQYQGIENPSETEIYLVPDEIDNVPTENSINPVKSGGVYTALAGKYSKPSGGIPSTDLASAVQTSLGKADTALQSFSESDPVFVASAAHGITSNDISNWNSKTEVFTYDVDADGIITSTSEGYHQKTINSSAPYNAIHAAYQAGKIVFIKILNLPDFPDMYIPLNNHDWAAYDFTLYTNYTVNDINRNVIIDIAVNETLTNITYMETSLGTYNKPSGGIPASDIASGVIPTNCVSSTDITNVVYLTQAAYDALATKDANTLYIIPES